MSDKLKKLKRQSSKRRRFRTVEELLENTPNLKDNRTGRKFWVKGKTTGLPLNKFVIKLLEMNEILPNNRKKTDTVLNILLYEEFPDWKPITERHKRNENVIALYRRYYNKGRLNRGFMPAKVSFRYDAEGYPINPHNLRRMTAEEIKAHIQHYRGLASAYVSQVRKRGSLGKSLQESSDAGQDLEEK